jgi:alkylhydroperoxidase/carboxymuconolactone decarboxylase family protein YurZ
MEKRKENWKYFKEKYPEIDEAYEAFGKSLHEKGGPLKVKQRWLIKIAISAASSFDLALRSHIERALTDGCEPDEIEHAIILTASTVGFPRMMSALLVFREEMARKDRGSIL